jgi:hypothetical protein
MTGPPAAQQQGVNCMLVFLSVWMPAMTNAIHTVCLPDQASSGHAGLAYPWRLPASSLRVAGVCCCAAVVPCAACAVCNPAAITWLCSVVVVVCVFLKVVTCGLSGCPHLLLMCSACGLYRRAMYA